MRDKRASAAATVVCVHGAGAGGWEWAIWARVLAARGFAVFAPDLQPAAAGIESTRLADYRAQVLEWCQGVDAPIVLVGASLGGRLALQAARAAAARALVLVNPLPSDGLAGSTPRPRRVPWGRERSLAGTRRAMADADVAARLHAFRRWRDESGAVLDEACARFPLERQACPVLVLASECDKDVPAAGSRALAAALTADFELLTAATHVGPLLGRDAAVTAARAADWIERSCLEHAAAHENLAAL
ncbi:MAG: alpha/beta hydrolase family protein [Dokdonella sp.]